ncbi:MAG: hypothetical protein J2O48_07715 [Solirubrobacterales bacterium]|nr:hypothetical protein [Solirubrobacterales bacterium]
MIHGTNSNETDFPFEANHSPSVVVTFGKATPTDTKKSSKSGAKRHG